MNPVHATCVAVDGRAVLIEGPSGSGKSDLALRLIDRGARLVSDDYTALALTDGVLTASAPPTIAGRIEVRGLGILQVAPLAAAPVALMVRAGTPERMPEPATCVIGGVTVPLTILSLLEPSAPLKVERALARVPR